MDFKATFPATNLETVCASELPFPLFNVVSDKKYFTFVNIEWGNGVFQGIVAAIVSSGGKFFAHV